MSSPSEPTVGARGAGGLTPERLNELRDVGAFASRLLGRPLWEHQLEFARSAARYRVLAAGRQSGKSSVLSVVALHRAATQPNQLVLLVSAGEVASRRLLDDCASLASASPLLRGSVLDESASLLTLSNGSQVRSVPASQRQIRGWPVDLLVLDEAGFIESEIWRASEPSIIARPGSQVVLSSTPWGGPDHFFRQLWRRGMDAPDDQVRSWHWASSVSPLVSVDLLDEIREREPAAYFAREYLAEFTDMAGTYFTSAELAEATVDYELSDPDSDTEDGLPERLGMVVGGVDWGMRRDANVLVVVGQLPEPDSKGRPRFRVVWLEEHFALPYDAWIDRLVYLAGRFQFATLASEVLGVGDYPTTSLDRRLYEAGLGGVVIPVATTAKLKENGFGLIALLFQQGRLELPPHPGLLRQLAGLEIERGETGSSRIAVPERVGHDDLAMGLCFAALQLGAGEFRPVVEHLVSIGELLDEPELDFYRIGPDI